MRLFLLELAKKSAMLFCIITCTSYLSAQEILIINSSTNEPIENVAIYNQLKNTSILTNENGIVHPYSVNYQKNFIGFKTS